MSIENEQKRYNISLQSYSFITGNETNETQLLFCANSSGYLTSLPSSLSQRPTVIAMRYFGCEDGLPRAWVSSWDWQAGGLGEEQSGDFWI